MINPINYPKTSDLELEVGECFDIRFDLPADQANDPLAYVNSIDGFLHLLMASNEEWEIEAYQNINKDIVAKVEIIKKRTSTHIKY